MAEICIKLGSAWFHTSNASVIGAGFVGNNLKIKETLAAYFEEVNSWSDFVKKVQTLNGFFAVAVRRGNECYIAVDRVRSVPLFYAVKENRFILSDDPYWIQNHITGKSYDLTSIVEFLLTGYVTGGYTLDQGIRQLQAGEALRVCNESVPVIHSERYYQFLTGKGEGSNASKDDLLRRLDEVTLAAIERLIKFAAGRTIVIPLSGGLDSRLIAMNLKRLGYKNILAFSYGVKGNWESRVSQEVAQQLGIPWHFVEYSRGLWKQWYWSDECQTYIKYASKLVSLAHLQDWPAVMELNNKGVLSRDVVIVPGHSMDFVAGSHIPAELSNFTKCDVQKLIQAIWQHHYVLMSPDLAAEHVGLDKQEALRSVLERLGAYFEHTKMLNIANAIGLYESWEWAERQAKYIVNSVRVYDFFGLDWWMPWWDQEVMSFWEYVPLELRVDRRLYREYVEQIQKRIGMKICFVHKVLLKSLFTLGLAKKLFIMFKSPLSSRATILGLDGAFNLKHKRGLSLNGIAALTQMRMGLERKVL